MLKADDVQIFELTKILGDQVAKIVKSFKDDGAEDTIVVAEDDGRFTVRALFRK